MDGYKGSTYPRMQQRHQAMRGESSDMIRQCTRGSPKRQFPAVALLTTVFMLLSSCYEPVPTYVSSPSKFDRAWNAALAAAQDEGVRLISEDRSTGVITGSRGDQDVTISVRTQADGSVRVELSARGPTGSDPGLAERISRAYDRHMGR
jgi:hypothetical protein